MFEFTTQNTQHFSRVLLLAKWNKKNQGETTATEMKIKRIFI